MRKIFVCLALTLLLGLPAMAQVERPIYPTVETSWGYSYTSLDVLQDRLNANGFQISAAYNFHENAGVVGDFGAQFRSATPRAALQDSFQYLFGPQFTLRDRKVAPFVHALFGGMTMHGGPDEGTGFAMGIGGGLNLDTGHRIGLRAIQFDYIPRRFEDQWKHHIRIGVGFLLK